MPAILYVLRTKKNKKNARPPKTGKNENEIRGTVMTISCTKDQEQDQASKAKC
jgi:hypothetical protein